MFLTPSTRVSALTVDILIFKENSAVCSKSSCFGKARLPSDDNTILGGGVGKVALEYNITC